MTIETTRKPTLIIVSGRPGSGKSTLAHTLAKTLSCPLVSRDEIYEGVFHTFAGDPELAEKDRLMKLTFEIFFRTIGLLLSSGVTFVAEAAFQNERWRIGLEPLVASADMKLIHCTVNSELARQRVIDRGREQQAHPDPAAGVNVRPFEPLSLSTPLLNVDTTDGYTPTLEEIVAFIKSR